MLLGVCCFTALRGFAVDVCIQKTQLELAKMPAFPGVKDFGSTTPGGTGGRVVEATNLDDSGPGSFRGDRRSQRTANSPIRGFVTSLIDPASRVIDIQPTFLMMEYIG